MLALSYTTQFNSREKTSQKRKRGRGGKGPVGERKEVRIVRGLQTAGERDNQQGQEERREEDRRWKREPKERMDRSVVPNAGGRRAEKEARCHPLTLLRPPEATRCCELGAGKDWEGTFSILDPWPGPCPGSAT